MHAGVHGLGTNPSYRHACWRLRPQEALLASGATASPFMTDDTYMGVLPVCMDGLLAPGRKT